MNRLSRHPILILALCAAAALVGAFATSALIRYRERAATLRNTQQVLVTFEGPWAFAADPDDATSIYAFAPKTATHSDLAVKSDGAPETLAAGVYEVLLHAIPETPDQTAISSTILQAKIDAQGVRHALAQRLIRYAVHLPRPEAYVSGRTGRMRAGSDYPPSPSTESNYAMDVSLRYRATTLAGFTVLGSPDDGSLRRVLVRNPNLSFAIRPLPEQVAMTMDECEMHNREAFRDLAKLVQLKMFVDFGKYATDCYPTDPQNPAVAANH